MKKWHKWGGLILSFFLIMFALSGIFLNHRDLITGIDVPRSILPPSYRYSNWNNGSAKGTLKLSPDSIFLFGGAGVFLTDSSGTNIIRFEEGMKPGMDNRTIGNILKMPDGSIFAATTFDLYQLNRDVNRWEILSEKLDMHERIADLQSIDNSLVVMTRSHFFVSRQPYSQFNKLELKVPAGQKREATLFRTMWVLHSGELFGIPGKIFVDLLGVVIIFLCITGLIYTFSPRAIKRRKKKKKNTKLLYQTMRRSINWHNKSGVYLFVFIFMLVLSGTFLRPPLLIAIIRCKVATIPGTTLHNPNIWFDKLRSIRYDHAQKEWILYSSDGFFNFKNFNDRPRRMEIIPPVSVMGVTVLEQRDSIQWLVGSFSGLYYWNRQTGKSIEAFTMKPAAIKRGGPPVITDAISGYSDDFGKETVVFDYNKGAKSIHGNSAFIAMPGLARKESRMSLWNMCLEIHVGRIYAPVLGFFTDFFIFFSGAFAMVVLISGYIVYLRRYSKRKKSKL